MWSGRAASPCGEYVMGSCEDAGRTTAAATDGWDEPASITPDGRRNGSWRHKPSSAWPPDEPTLNYSLNYSARLARLKLADSVTITTNSGDKYLTPTVTFWVLASTISAQRPASNDVIDLGLVVNKQIRSTFASNVNKLLLVGSKLFCITAFQRIFCKLAFFAQITSSIPVLRQCRPNLLWLFNVFKRRLKYL